MVSRTRKRYRLRCNQQEPVPVAPWHAWRARAIESRRFWTIRRWTLPRQAGTPLEAEGDLPLVAWRHNPRSKQRKPEERHEEGIGPTSRFRLLRVLRAARCDAGFELSGCFGQLLGNFAEKLSRALFGFRRDFLFQIPAQASQLFVKSASQFFKFVHRHLAAECKTRFRYYRNAKKRVQGGGVGTSLPVADAVRTLEEPVQRDVWGRRAAAATVPCLRGTRRHSCDQVSRVRDESAFLFGGHE